MLISKSRKQKRSVRPNGKLSIFQAALCSQRFSRHSGEAERVYGENKVGVLRGGGFGNHWTVRRPFGGDRASDDPGLHPLQSGLHRPVLRRGHSAGERGLRHPGTGTLHKRPAGKSLSAGAGEEIRPRIPSTPGAGGQAAFLRAGADGQGERTGEPVPAEKGDGEDPLPGQGLLGGGDVRPF